MYHKRHAPENGFTLTELAIVLGVIGTILGAVWTAAARVQANNKVERAFAEATQLVNNFRTLYSQHSIDMSDWTDITCIGLRNNFFPADMVPAGAACTASVSGTTTYAGTLLPTPWGNGTYVNVQVHQTYSGINVGFNSLSQQACNALADAITTPPDMLYENVNGHAQWMPPYAATTAYTPVEINGFCAPGNGNYVNIMYKT